MSKKEITIICVAYKRYDTIHVLINSILCQTLNNWKLLIIHDGPDEKMQALLEQYAKVNENLEYMFTEKRHNDYGHSLREMGIKKADTEFLMMTNDDNYYMPVFLEYMFSSIRGNDLDFVLCNMIHNYPHPESGLSYVLFESLPKINHIDIGNFIVKTSIAKDVGFRGRSPAADGAFVELVKARFGEKIRMGKISNVLFVHN